MVGVQLFSPLHSGEARGNTQRRNHWNASNTLRCRTSFSPKHILIPHHSHPFNRQLRRTGQHDVKAVHINLGKLCQGGDNWEMVMEIIMNNFDEIDNHWNRINMMILFIRATLPLMKPTGELWLQTVESISSWRMVWEWWTGGDYMEDYMKDGQKALISGLKNGHIDLTYGGRCLVVESEITEQYYIR